MRASRLLRAASNAAGPSQRPPPPRAPPPGYRSPLPSPIRKSLLANAAASNSKTTMPPGSPATEAKTGPKTDDSQKSMWASYMALDWKSRLLLGGILLAFAGITKGMDSLVPEEDKLETVLDRGPSNTSS